MSIRLLLFDLDDTLWPCKPTIVRAERALYEWLCERIPGLRAEQDIDSLRHWRQDFMLRHPELNHDLTRVRRASLLEVCARYHADPALADAGTALFCAERNRVEPYPEVIPVLSRLRADFTLVSLTNGNADVEQTPLRGLFHLNLNSIGVGHAKPHSAMFLRAMETMGVAAEQVVMIGDDEARDIAPARALGMRTVWVRRGGGRETGGADLTVPDLRPLPAWLRRP